MVTWRGSWRVRSSKAEQARVPSSVVTDRSGLIWIIKRGGSPGKPRQHPTWARYALSYAPPRKLSELQLETTARKTNFRNEARKSAREA